MTRFASLLRGVNVGSHRKVTMAELREVYGGLGLADVETYRQSGNVVFSSRSRSARRLEATIEEALQETFGYPDVDVLVRDHADLRALADANPFLAGGAPPAILHVTFLKDEPSGRVDWAGRTPEGPDEFAVARRAVYVRCPGGYGQTKLNNGFFERLTGVRATTRNWATVTQLRDLTAG